MKTNSSVSLLSVPSTAVLCVPHTYPPSQGGKFEIECVQCTDVEKIYARREPRITDIPLPYCRPHGTLNQLYQILLFIVGAVGGLVLLCFIARCLYMHLMSSGRSRNGSLRWLMRSGRVSNSNARSHHRSGSQPQHQRSRPGAVQNDTPGNENSPEMQANA